jgi:hypothetical protein
MRDFELVQQDWGKEDNYKYDQELQYRIGRRKRNGR